MLSTRMSMGDGGGETGRAKHASAECRPRRKPPPTLQTAAREHRRDPPPDTVPMLSAYAPAPHTSRRRRAPGGPPTSAPPHLGRGSTGAGHGPLLSDGFPRRILQPLILNSLHPNIRFSTLHFLHVSSPNRAYEHSVLTAISCMVRRPNIAHLWHPSGGKNIKNLFFGFFLQTVQ